MQKVYMPELNEVSGEMIGHLKKKNSFLRAKLVF